MSKPKPPKPLDSYWVSTRSTTNTKRLEAAVRHHVRLLELGGVISGCPKLMRLKAPGNPTQMWNEAMNEVVDRLSSMLFPSVEVFKETEYRAYPVRVQSRSRVSLRVAIPPNMDRDLTPYLYTRVLAYTAELLHTKQGVLRPYMCWLSIDPENDRQWVNWDVRSVRGMGSGNSPRVMQRVYEFCGYACLLAVAIKYIFKFRVVPPGSPHDE